MPTHFNGSPEEQQALDAYIKLWRASASVEARANRHLSQHGLSLSQFSVLEALYHLGPLSQRALGHKILRSSGNLTLVIDNLEKAGLVRRERGTKDRRVVTVNLTEPGRALIAAILPGHVRGIVEIFAALTSEERAELARLAKKVGLGEPDRAPAGSP